MYGACFIARTGQVEKTAPGSKAREAKRRLWKDFAVPQLAHHKARAQGLLLIGPSFSVQDFVEGFVKLGFCSGFYLGVCLGLAGRRGAESRPASTHPAA